jgi:Squalene-hopene cyclase C-terminal domain/Prenyltransferase and squalene oxidase repeat
MAETRWTRQLRFSPLPVLQSAKSEPLRYFCQQDLLGQKAGPVESLWSLREAREITDRQLASGSWRYSGGRLQIRSQRDYDQLETFRALRKLVEKYGMNRENPAIERAGEFLFSCQTDEGDFRGLAGNQYVPYYSAAFMELLIKAGFSDDPRIAKGFRWLLSMRQLDGGWAFPLRTAGKKLSAETFRASTIYPDKAQPFSHLVTGVVLRAFAAHPEYRRAAEARLAGRLLESRFFERDCYPDRSSPSFWTSFSYPFWFTDLLSALDSLSRLGFEEEDPQVRKGLEWFASRQKKDGGWRLPLRLIEGEKERDLWITLAISRVFKRFADRGKTLLP